MVGFVLLAVFARTVLPVWLGSVIIFVAPIGWIAIVEFSRRDLRSELPHRFSFVWGRLTPLGLASAMLLSTLSGLIGIWFSNISQVGFFIAGLLLVITVLWFLVGGEVVIALWIARVAESKGRSFTAWFWLGFLFPIISWIIVATMGPQSARAVSHSIPAVVDNLPRLDNGGIEHKQCPYCGEDIRAVAVKCKHCGEFLSERQGP